MKKLFFTFFLCGLITSVAQNKQVLYGFDKIPQGLLLNPGAEVSYKYHIGVPMLSGISVTAGTSGITLADLFRDDNVGIFAGTNFNTKLSNALAKLGDNDYAYINTQIEALSGGYKINNRDYISAGFYTELDAFISYPKDGLTLITEGNAAYLNKAFSVAQFNVKAEVVGVLHAGISRKFNNRFTAGTRLKIYSGSANVVSTNNEGTFTTTKGTDNIYVNSLNRLDVEANTSGLLSSEDKFDATFGSIYGGSFFGGNFGLGLDFGFTYYLNQQIEITASLLDVGFVSYSKNTNNATIKGDYTFSGIEFQYTNAADYWAQLETDFEKKVPRERNNNSYTTMRPIKLNGSYTYRFGKSRNEANCHDITYKDFYDNGVGGQLYADFRPNGIRFAFTGFYERKFSNYLNTKVTYTIDDFSATNFGVGISANIWKLNIYGMVDNIFKLSDVANAHRASLQFGINYIVN